MSSCEYQSRIIKEFNIPVPWGHISVKAWGNHDDPHVLMVHGTTDNAGTFDNLIPFLPNSFYYICIDLPGHGRSSHLPPFVSVHYTHYLIACRLIVDYFKKERYIFIGHSLGGQIGFLFCRLYSDRIEKFISLDGLPFFPVEARKANKYLRVILDRNFDHYLKSEPAPAYRFDEILEKICKNRYHGEHLTEEAAKPLLKRCLEPTGHGKYYVTTDERVKFPLNPLHDSRYALESLRMDPVRCPVLVVIAIKNSYPRETYKLIYKHLTKRKNIKIVYVDGKHDVHNNRPKVVAPHVAQFLLSQKSKM